MCIMHNDGCHFVLTNEDSTFPSHGAFYPGSGAISAPLKFSTGKTPIVVGASSRFSSLSYGRV
jgi:4-nitrophenyl phosphatase